jgi:hypothetical protein
MQPNVSVLVAVRNPKKLREAIAGQHLVRLLAALARPMHGQIRAMDYGNPSKLRKGRDPGPVDPGFPMPACAEVTQG